jgi:hypothetical protein
LDPRSGYGSPNRKLYGKTKRANNNNYSSKDVKKMSIMEIKKLLFLNGNLKFD